MPPGKTAYRTSPPRRLARETAIHGLALLWLSRKGGFQTAGSWISLLLRLSNRACDLDVVAEGNTMRGASKKPLRGLATEGALSMARGG